MTTREDDVKIAEIMGAEWHDIWVSDEKSQVLYFEDEIDYYGMESLRKGYLISAIPEFLTAPSFESDGIVLEWAQGQDVVLANKFYYELGRIVERDDKGTPFQLAKVLEHYEPGDYAKALLEVYDESN